MSDLAELIRERGELASLGLAALVLWLATPRVAALLALPRERVGSLYWNGALAFVVAGRVGYLLDESPDTLLDPLVAIRVQGGIDPLWGAAAALAVLGWEARGSSEATGEAAGAAARWPLATAWAAGLALAVAAYDLGCPLRDACFGAQAEPPLGFAMSGLADTRLATPAVEGAALLALAGALLLGWARWRPGAAALALLAGVALLRLALAPLSVLGWPGWGVEEVALALVGAAALGGAAWLQLHGTRATPAREAPA